MTTITEADVEQAALDWLSALGWQVAHGPDIAPETPNAERADYGQVVLERRLRDALAGTQPGAAPRRSGRRVPQADPPGGRDPGGPQPRLPPDAGRRRDGRVPGRRGARSRDAGAGRRLRRPRQQRLAGRQPAHRHREPEQAQARRGAVRQRPAPGRDRAQEPGGRGRHRLDGVAAAPDLQGRAADAVLHERAARRLGRQRGARRHAHRRAGVVQALAHRDRRGPRRPPHDRAAGDARGRLRARPAPRAGARLHRVRGRRRRRAVEEDGGLSPATRGARRGRRDTPRGRAAAQGSWPRSTRDTTRPDGSRAGTRATAASASSGTLRAPARA